MNTPKVYPKEKTVRDVELETDTRIGTDESPDGSDKKYSRANPPTTEKSEKANRKMPNLTSKEWERVTPEHPAKHDLEEGHP